MNTTFTNYAEKKAKQFFNLLQGYTKGVRITAILILLLMGVSDAWGADNTVVGVAGTNSSDYTVKLNVNRKGDGSDWQNKTMSKAGITFEGKKLYITSYEKLYGGLGNMQFQYYDGSTWKEQKEPINGWNTSTHDNEIYNYDSGSWYSKLSFNTSARFFFDATGWDETSIKLCIGHANYQKYYTLTRITNTNLYYGNTSDTWGDAMGIGVVGNTSATNGTNWLTNVSSKAKEYTGFKHYELSSANTNNAYLMVNNGKAGQEPEITYHASHYSTSDGLNYTQTVKYSLSTNGSTHSVMTSGTTPSKITMSSYKFVSGTYNSVTSESPTALSENSSTYAQSFTAARTATTTLTISNIIAGATFDGWYDAATGGNLLSSSTSYTYYPTAETTIYARFTKSVPKYTITFGVEGTGGTVAAKVGSTTINTGSSHDENTSIVFTAIPSTGYHFSKWIDANGNQLSTSTPYTHTLTANATVKAVFNLNTYYVKFNANGGSGTMSNQLFTYGTSQYLTANAFTRDGYKFAGWATSTSGSVVYADEESVKNLTSTNNGTYNLYAKWTEITSTVTVTTANEAYGTLKFGSTATDWGTTASVGVSTSQQITATANEGYKFVKWELSGRATSTSALTNKTITIKADGSGNAGTVTAVFEEDLNSSWHLVGSDNIFPAGWNVNDNSMMKKRSGFSSEKKVYMTITVSNINETYQFKVVDDNGNDSDKWYGYSSGNNFLEWTETSTKDVYTTTQEYNNDNNLKFTPNAVGDYEFKVDYSGGNPKVTITYPEVGSVSSYSLVGDWGNGWDATGIAFNAEGKVSLELEKRERPDYTFKVKASNGKHYTAADEHKRQFTRQHNIETISDDTDYPVDDPHNLQLQADAKGTYIFEFNPATKQLKVTHPEREDGAYLVGDFSDGQAGTDADNPGYDWTEEHGKQFTTNANQTEGTVEICDWTGKNSTWNFKVKINGIWYGLKETMNTSGRWILTDDYAHLSTKNCTIQTNGKDGCYTFRYTTLNNSDIELQIVFPNDTRIVTFNKNGYGTAPAQQTILYGKTATKPIMDDADGYMFAGWYTDEACTAGKEYDFDTPVESNIILYAKWIPYTQCIFFKNNLNWDKDNIYIYTFSDNVWHNGEDQNNPNDDKGVQPKVNRIEYGKMTQIGYTDIYYYALTDLEGFNHIAFSDHDMHDYGDFFHNHSGIYRSDRSDKMQLFIPQTDQSPQEHNGTKYYSSGLWMKYNSTESGYNWSSNANSWSTTANTFTAEKAGGYSFTTEVKLTAGTTYKFKIHNLNGTWFGNGGTMTQTNCTNWSFGNDNDSDAQITPTITGNYIFTIYLGDGEVRVSLDYPLSVGDYRLVYKDNTHGAHDGHYIKKRTDIAEQRDTVSFFIHKDKSPQILLQYCHAISNDGRPTWRTADNDTYTSLGDAVTTTAVYNFILKQTNNGNTHSRSIVTEETHKYTGNFYIRTDAAAGGWKTFRQEGNRMTYSSFAESNTNPKFNHYFCEWITANRNVKFTIANDYSYCISDTLDGDNIINKTGVSPGCLPADANVRFGWDSRDNSLSRAYIAGSGLKKDRFLVIEGNSYLTDKEGHAYTGNTAEGQERFNLKDHEVVLDDMGNWIYQMDVTANSKTEYKLTALYNNIVQYFKGTRTTTERMLATNNHQDTRFKIRLIYDFKTNHIVAAWLADDTPGELGADMMVIRKNQGDATQIAFNGKKLTNVQKAYAVMTFTKDFVNGSEPIRARKHYWISFPFDVKISEVFGFSEYMDHWILQLYDGQKRADEGWWYESGTFWKYITNRNYTLKKGVGYVLTLDLSKMGESSNVFENTDEVSLYFPSTGLINTISGKEETSTTVDPHECTIERENRYIYDSHWNIIGVPGFADISTYSTSTPIINDDQEKGGGPSFYYKYLPEDNSYQATTTENTFKTMYGYMVQYTGTLSWTTTIAVPNNIAARRNSDNTEPEKVSLRLEIAQDEEMADQTFVQLQQEGATAEFDMNLDLTKIINSGANIYTLAGEQRIQSAGNALPMGEVIVPVGVKIATEGEYTLRMPDGTEGMVVELIDYERDITTNLLLFDYTVTLPAGSNESRFALHIQPNNSGVTTGVENVGDKAKGIEKYLIDGKLMIRTAEGVIYDAQGHVVQ